MLNPANERFLYENEGDTDKKMVLLTFSALNNTDCDTKTNRNECVKQQHRLLGAALSWFAVHLTSMNNTNLVRKTASRLL